MAKTRVLIADGLGPEGQSKLQDLTEIELIDAKGIERSVLMKELKEVEILIVRSRTQVDQELLECGHKLKLVIRAGIGLDNVDVPAATNHGVVVMNAPTGNIVTTAEHAVALMFAVSRHIGHADRSLREGLWEKKKLQGSELRGKTLGVVGLGNIGRTVAQIAQGIGMKIIGSDPMMSKEVAARQNIRLTEFENVLQEADYVTIHVPLLPSTKHLISTKELGMMKKEAYLLNCARGGIVDEAALVKALENQDIQGAALDVFEQEPIPKDHPFLKLDNIVMTPHLGASTDEAQTQVSLEVAEEITQYVQNGVLKNAINVPNLSLEQLEILKPFVSLSEKLGAFLAQIGPSHVDQIKVRYLGEICNEDTEVLTLSVLKGFLDPHLSAAVNFVNARKVMKERGIRVEESFEQQIEDYSNLIEVEIHSKDSALKCAGTLFGRQAPRIVRVDNFDIDAVPNGTLLYTKNTDRPGVIGTMGSLLGKSGCNISRMALGFDKAKGQAIALINVDSKVSKETLETLRTAEGMVSAIQVQL